MSQIELKEFEWYFRDHLYRNYRDGITNFKLDTIQNDIAKTYLRYRNTSLGDISKFLSPVIDLLVSRKVLKLMDNSIELEGQIYRMQCSKCFYICYIGENESIECLRCSSHELNTFPKKIK